MGGLLWDIGMRASRSEVGDEKKTREILTHLSILGSTGRASAEVDLSTACGTLFATE